MSAYSFLFDQTSPDFPNINEICSGTQEMNNQASTSSSTSENSGENGTESDKIITEDLSNRTPRKDAIERLNSKTDSAVDLVWNPLIEKDLINYLKSAKVLWDPRMLDYRNGQKRAQAYEDLSQHLQELWPCYTELVTVETCKRKISSLRASYRREKKKMNLNKDFDYQPRWIHFKRMSFIPLDLNDPDEKGAAKIPRIESVFSTPPTDESNTFSTFDDHNFSEVNNDTVSDESNDANTSPQNEQLVAIHHSPRKSPRLRQATSTDKKYPSVNSHQHTEATKEPKQPDSVPQNGPSPVVRPVLSNDDPFIQFIAHDLSKLPEGNQKENLKFKMMELLHKCKINPNFLLD